MPDVGDGTAAQAALVDDATMAVVAHQLLSSLAVIAGNSAILRDNWDALSSQQRRSILDKIERHAVHAGAHLRGLAGGRLLADAAP